MHITMAEQHTFSFSLTGLHFCSSFWLGRVLGNGAGLLLSLLQQIVQHRYQLMCRKTCYCNDADADLTNG